jgi:DUF1680 family protein
VNSSPSGPAAFGPVQPTSSAVQAQKPLPHRAIRLDEDGWLGAWQRRNAEATIPHVLDNLETGEAWSNLARVVGASTASFRGMFFTDSDIYKLLEALAWADDSGRLDPASAKRGDKLVELLREVQDADGYLNSYVQGTPGHERFSDPQWGHELYTAGHLFQAAVAASRAGVMDDLVAVARRFADLLVTTLGEQDSAYLDGHPEVETAMVELYRMTGEASYLTFARQQLERRGQGWLGPDRFGSAYFQDHEPVRTATRATGHAVRQLYLFTGAVDVAVETGDLELLAASERLWEDLFGTKTYISGAHGSRHRDEAIGDAYELPPDRAYAETCAAIASFQWNWRLLLATGKARYAQEMETALYNAIAVSTSLAGTEFFYSNPLQLRAEHDGAHEDAPSQRLPWFSCACCPPNISRLLASVHNYLVTTTEASVTLQHYSSGTIEAEVGGNPARIELRSGYPFDGAVSVLIDGAGEWTLGLRIPSWCEEFSLSVNGERVDAAADDGYVTIRRDWAGRTELHLDLSMPVRLVHPHPRVDAVRGCVAVTRGPLVFALEQAGLDDGVALEDVRLLSASGAVESPWPQLSPTAVQLEVAVARPSSPALYRDNPEPASTEIRQVYAIPYHRWANRDPGAMRVWIPLAVGAAG